MTKTIPYIGGPLVYNNYSSTGSLLKIQDIYLNANIKLGTAGNLNFNIYNGSPNVIRFEANEHNGVLKSLIEFDNIEEDWETGISGSFAVDTYTTGSVLKLTSGMSGSMDTYVNLSTGSPSEIILNAAFTTSGLTNGSFQVQLESSAGNYYYFNGSATTDGHHYPNYSVAGSVGAPDIGSLTTVRIETNTLTGGSYTMRKLWTGADTYASIGSVTGGAIMLDAPYTLGSTSFFIGSDVDITLLTNGSYNYQTVMFKVAEDDHGQVYKYDYVDDNNYSYVSLGSIATAGIVIAGSTTKEVEFSSSLPTGSYYNIVVQKTVNEHFVYLQDAVTLGNTYVAELTNNATANGSEIHILGGSEGTAIKQLYILGGSGTSAYTSFATSGSFHTDVEMRLALGDPILGGSDVIGIGPSATIGSFNITATAYYPFNGNANDESSNSNNGVVNGATLVADHLGNPNNAYAFENNETDNIEVLIPSFSTDWTISVRANMYDKFNRNSICGDGNGTHGFITLYPNNGTVGFEPSSTNNKGCVITVPNFTDYEGEYHEYTIQANSGSISFFINGSLIDTEAATDGITDLYPRYIGRGYTGVANSYFTGSISSILFTEEVLSQAKIQELVEMNNSHKLDKPVVSYTDGTGSTITGYDLFGVDNFGQRIRHPPLGNTSASFYIEVKPTDYLNRFWSRNYGSSGGARNGSFRGNGGTGSSWNFYIRQSGGANINIEDSAEYTLGSIYKLFATVDKTNKVAKFYVNGTLVGSEAFDGTLATSGNQAIINEEADSSNTYSSAIYANATRWTRVLTDTERETLFQYGPDMLSTKWGSPSGFSSHKLVARYHTEGPSGSSTNGTGPFFATSGSIGYGVLSDYQGVCALVKSNLYTGSHSIIGSTTSLGSDVHLIINKETDAFNIFKNAEVAGSQLFSYDGATINGPPMFYYGDTAGSLVAFQQVPSNQLDRVISMGGSSDSLYMVVDGAGGARVDGFDLKYSLS